MIKRLVSLLVITLSGCATQEKVSSQVAVSENIICQQLGTLKAKLLQTSVVEDGIKTPLWDEGVCEAQRTNNNRIYACAWQLQAAATAKTYWRYQFDRIRSCFDGAWFHKVDFNAHHAYFKAKEPFSMSLRYVKQRNAKIIRYQVTLTFSADAPLIVD